LGVPLRPEGLTLPWIEGANKQSGERCQWLGACLRGNFSGLYASICELIQKRIKLIYLKNDFSILSRAPFDNKIGVHHQSNMMRKRIVIEL